MANGHTIEKNGSAEKKTYAIHYQQLDGDRTAKGGSPELAG